MPIRLMAPMPQVHVFCQVERKGVLVKLDSASCKMEGLVSSSDKRMWL